MTTPADNTPVSIIQDGYFDAGLLEEGQPPNSEQIVSGMRRLTDLINLWQVRPGLKLWLNVDTPIPLVAGTGLYTLGPAGTVAMTKPLRVLESYWLSQNGIRRPLVPLSWNDYVRLAQVNQSGTINSYFVDKQQLTLNVFFWQPPDSIDALGTGHVLLQTQVANFTNVTETMNFPIEWRMALRWGLADELATGQPAAIMDRCQMRAAMYLQVLEDWDVEDAPTRFAPNTQQTQPSRFR